tara:strand:- start:83 stop:184 length:102 start_codon:yes stop_codon:yes gene_type:complete
VDAGLVYAQAENAERMHAKAAERNIEAGMRSLH